MNTLRIKIEQDTTLLNLLDTNSKLSLFKNYSKKYEQFLNVKDSKGLSNKEEILVNHFDTVARINEQGKILKRDFGSIIVKEGTNLIIEEDKLPMDIAPIGEKNLIKVFSSNEEGFYGEYLNLIESIKLKEKVGKTDITISENKYSVWVWSRTLDEVIDLSPFINSLSITVNGVSNSFSIQMQGFENLKDSINHIDVNYIDLIKEDKTAMSWMAKNLQRNDVVFIRFEELSIEQNSRPKTIRLKLPNSILSSDDNAVIVYDMIGLVDTVQETTQNTDIKVSIDGRDLMKLITDDGAYFYPLMYLDNSETTIFNTDTLDKDKWFKRNVFQDGQYNSIFHYNAKSIQDSISFIINQLSNLGVVPNDLFASNKNRRTRTLTVKGDKKEQISWSEVNGLWQIIKVLFDAKLEDRRFANGSLINPNASLMTLINEVCMNPFVEFYGDTYGDEYNLIVRQPPFTKSEILTVLDSGNIIDIESENLISMNLSYSEQYFTSYQLDCKSALIPFGDTVALAYLPIVYFPEIAEIWGNNRRVDECKYIVDFNLQGDSKAFDLPAMKNKSVEDFCYIIETNSVLPFTRQGTITIKGDRRIKAKNYVRNKATGEIFYVESVSNSMTNFDKNIDRTTMMSVSRGMVEFYIKGDSDHFSYFDVVDVNRIKKVLRNKLYINQGDSSKVTEDVKQTTVTTKFGLNKDAFEFFLKRRQWD